MSRIGRRPIAIPSGVTVDIKASTVKIKGSKGELSLQLTEGISAIAKDGKVALTCAQLEDKQQKAYFGLMRAMVNNMINGVTHGYKKELEIVGVGFKAQMKGKDIQLNLGFSHPVDVVVPSGIKVSIPNPTRIILEGIDKQLIGQIAADIRAIYPPEPYKGKGIRYVGEYVRKKLGKAMAK